MKNQKANALSKDYYKSDMYISNDINKASTFYESKLTSYISTLLFVGIDLACLCTLWNIVQTESAWLVTLIAVGCAVCLDVPMAIAGLTLKRYHQKLMDKKSTAIIVILSILTFIITFIFSLWFRLETKDLTFEIGSSGMVNSLAAETTSDEESKAVFVAALYSGIVPFCTSIASFVIGYFSANPLKDIIVKYQNSHIQLTSKRIDLIRATEEAKQVDDYREFLIARERDGFDRFCQECKYMGELRKQATGIALAERLTNTDGISQVTESRSRLPGAGADDEPYTRATELISKRKDNDYEETA